MNIFQNIHAWDTNGFDLYIYIKGKYEKLGV